MSAPSLSVLSSKADARRRAVFLDLENQLGRAPESAQPSHWTAARRTVLAAAGFRRGVDHLTIGIGKGNAPAAFHELGGYTLAIGSGEDGADHALTDRMHVAFLAAHFDEVVIGSGDGHFAEVAARLRAAGVVVIVVGVSGTIATRLRLAASQVILTDACVEAGSAATRVAA